MDTRRINLRIQKWIVTVAITLFVLKVVAYFLTNSVSILTDALESTVNVIAGLIGLYSLTVSAKPRDANHPYGHGKAEFISAAVEGTLMGIAGLIIIYESVKNMIFPPLLKQLNSGIALIVISAVINFVMGHIAIYHGKKNNSLALQASGKHLKSDTYSTLAIIAGLILIYYTKINLIDSAVAIAFAFFIVFTSYHIVRSSIAGIMDEADLKLLAKMVTVLNKNRRENWIDLHNLRVIKYGSILHIDCHLTVPWYLNVAEAHREIENLSDSINDKSGEPMELFVHSDGCLYSQCPICSKHDCPVRQQLFQQRIEWTLENIITDKKHQLT
ncbi:MAG: cation diffusion facilitator family transporter [Chitinophagaceae bacterium]